MIAYFTVDSDGRLPRQDGTIRVDGQDYLLPMKAQVGGFLAPRRILEGLQAAGWKPATDYYSDLDVDGPGSIRVVPLDGDA
ncbi:hypothetical protein FHR83_006780 [Actinoplanes campanulatus]|uniref:Uncharacterized protein n=1 Tax=Actinoplanes campanulatus TaxID=113559 RepID=A0A7W5ANK0_9ACTN|nr:hypothetical protein [Actinoplanes campanulatus]MBB3099074.1 hypothetical protein [Actinoplanes campanulatus]GGN39155.1 hypothetical protein GCM10010109_66780 [Actinoplanes campanulatus]GID40231.1 hypothetical protein Aca09nite_67370 [Actinoplanes campanulatus]